MGHCCPYSTNSLSPVVFEDGRGGRATDHIESLVKESIARRSHTRDYWGRELVEAAMTSLYHFNTTKYHLPPCGYAPQASFVPVVVHVADEHGVEGVEVSAEDCELIQDEELRLLSVPFAVSFQLLFLLHSLDSLFLQLLQSWDEVASEQVRPGFADDWLGVHCVYKQRVSRSFHIV